MRSSEAQQQNQGRLRPGSPPPLLLSQNFGEKFERQKFVISMAKDKNDLSSNHCKGLSHLSRAFFISRLGPIRGKPVAWQCVVGREVRRGAACERRKKSIRSSGGGPNDRRGREKKNNRATRSRRASLSLSPHSVRSSSSSLSPSILTDGRGGDRHDWLVVLGFLRLREEVKKEKKRAIFQVGF